MENYDKDLRAFIKAMNSARVEFAFYSERVSGLDKATQDILHQFELGNAKDRNKWATRLTKIRKERREAKDKVALLKPMVDYSNNNQVQIKAIERVLGDVRATKKNQANRNYTPKAIEDLDIAIKGCI